MRLQPMEWAYLTPSRRLQVVLLVLLIDHWQLPPAMADSVAGELQVLADLNVDETSVVEREMDGKEKLPAPFPYISHNVILSEPIN